MLRIIENDDQLTYAEFLTLEETCFPKDPYGLEQFRDIDKHFYLVARKNHKAVGYCYTKMHGEALYIHRLAVLLEYRRQGIGKNMLEKTFEHARKYNIKTCMLTVDAANAPAYELYVKMGFKELVTKYRYTFDTRMFDRSKNVYCVKNGESGKFDVFFYMEDEKIGSCRYNVDLTGCKDFMIQDPVNNLSDALSSLIGCVGNESGKIHVMTDDASVANVLNKLRYDNKKVMKEMVFSL